MLLSIRPMLEPMQTRYVADSAHQPMYLSYPDADSFTAYNFSPIAANAIEPGPAGAELARTARTVCSEMAVYRTRSSSSKRSSKTSPDFRGAIELTSQSLASMCSSRETMSRSPQTWRQMSQMNKIQKLRAAGRVVRRQLRAVCLHQSNP